MRPSSTRALLLALLFVVGGAAAPRDEPDLRLGDKAPRLSGLEWLQGRPVRSFRRGVVHVIDFWSTDPAGRASHQYVADVLRAHPGEVEAVGVIVPPAEDDGDEDDEEEAVVVVPLAEEPPPDDLPPLEEQFAQLVAASPEVLTYPVAVDRKGRTTELYLEDSGCADLDLPLSVVLDGRGRVAWIGSPDLGLAECVAELLDDRWDDDAARERFEAAWAERRALTEEMEHTILSVGRTRALGEERRELELVTRLATRDPLFSEWRLALIRLLRQSGRGTATRAEARRFLDGPAGRKPFQLVRLARELSYAAPDGYNRDADLELAFEAAQRAVDLNRGFDPAPLDMLALIQGFRGELGLAVEHQTRAVQRAPEWERASLGRTLDQYRGMLAGGRLADADAADREPPTLRLGDRAPPLHGVEWIKGRGTRGFRSSRVYVLDFWAPWCAPCLASIPYLDELARRRAGEVEVLGISIWPKPDIDTTAEFMQRWDERISYDVAEDVQQGVTASYMDATRSDGIPTTMVVDRSGRLVWIGWPDEQLDAILDAVLDGTWDVDAERARYEGALDAERQRARLEAEHRELIEAAFADESAERYAEAAERAIELVALDPLFEHWRVFAYRMLSLDGRPDEAAEVGNAFFDGPLARDAAALGDFAWRIIEADSGLDRALLDTDFALRLATRAVELSSRRDTWLLCVLGATHGRRAEWDAGVAAFEAALALDGEGERRINRSWIEGQLRQYRDHAADVR